MADKTIHFILQTIHIFACSHLYLNVRNIK